MRKKICKKKNRLSTEQPGESPSPSALSAARLWEERGGGSWVRAPQGKGRDGVEEAREVINELLAT